MDKDISCIVEKIEKAKTVVFLTGAGISADSNIPTFRDKEGYWRNFPAFKRAGLEAQTLASPRSFRRCPQYAWAFYEWRRRNAHQNKPHAGYTVINKLIEKHFKKTFIHTTNTDGHHLISGTKPSSVCEVHGSMWRLQCMREVGCNYGVRENLEVPLCDLDKEKMEAGRLPICPICGDLLRPNILMFGDWDYIENTYQKRNWYSFLEEVKVPDVVFLIGSSSTIATNDSIASRLKQNGSYIITINPQVSSLSFCKPDAFMQMKAKDALLAIYESLQLDNESSEC